MANFGALADTPSPKRFAINSQTLLTLLVAALLSFNVYTHFHTSTPEPAPAVKLDPEYVELGKRYSPVLSGTYGDAWENAANAIDSGKSVAEAFKQMSLDWNNGRLKVFTERITPALNKLLPEGTEPTTPEQRKAYALALRSFAAGLKGDATAKRHSVRTIVEDY